MWIFTNGFYEWEIGGSVTADQMQYSVTLQGNGVVHWGDDEYYETATVPAPSGDDK